MKFKYQAKTREGEAQVGFVDAANRDGAMNILSSHELFILQLDAVEKPGIFDKLTSFTRRVRSNDMVVFTRQLATLLEARLPLNNALLTLRDQTSNSSLREAIGQIHQDVDAGLSFSQALERQQETFPSFFISMIRSAEVTGNLDQVSGFLADYTEREALLAGKVKSALIYPSVVIVLFFVVGIVVLMTVFPQLQSVYETAGVKLPFISMALIGIGAFLGRWWFVVVLAFIVAAFMVIDYVQTPEGKAFIDDMKVRIPVLKKMFLPITVTRFANAAGMLVKGGIPIAQAIEIVGESVDNVFYRDILHEISEDVRQGMAFSEAVARYPNYFPPLVAHMLVVGEATGSMDQILGRIATFYGREADSMTGNLVELIQPALMIIVGVLVGLLFASIMLPLYQLTSAIQ